MEEQPFITISLKYASQILWSAARSCCFGTDPTFICFQVQGLQVCKVLLNGSFFEKHLFNSTAFPDTGNKFSNLLRSTCVQLDNMAAAAQMSFHMCVFKG